MRAVFVTGATGFLGGELLRRLLQWEPNTEATVLIRAVDDATAAERGRTLLQNLFADPDERASAARRMHVVRGDVSAPRLGLTTSQFDEIVARSTDYFNLACDVRFGLPVDDALAISLGGARGVFELAERANRRGGTPRLHHVSTYGVGRPCAGSTIVLEEAPDRAGVAYHNSYEAAKAAAELHLIDRAGDVSLAVYRPSVVLGDSRTGWTQDFKVTYTFWRLYAAGLLPADSTLLIEDGGRIDEVHVDYAADCLYALSTRTHLDSGSIFAIVAGVDAPLTAPALRASLEALRYSVAMREGTLLPIPRIESVDSLTDELVEQTYTDPTLRAVMREFRPYFSSRWRYDDRHTSAALRGTGITHRMDAGTPTVLLDYCVRSRWGRRSEPRPALGSRPHSVDAESRVREA